MVNGIADILKNAADQKTKKEKVNVLRKTANGQVLTVLKYTLSPRISWDLPEGAPPYKPANKNMDLQGVLYAALRKLHYYMPGNNIRAWKREQMFTQLLEQVDPDDAKLLLAMKDKKLPFGLTESVIKEAFPDHFENWKKNS